MDQQFELAVTLLKQAVKQSHLDNQPHIDLTLVDASRRAEFEEALAQVNKAVIQGAITRPALLKLLGL